MLNKKMVYFSQKYILIRALGVLTESKEMKNSPFKSKVSFDRIVNIVCREPFV